MSVLLALVTFVLVVISVFMVLLILMQRAKSDGGVGAALGGGMAESAFGGDTANVLTRATQYAAVLFFVLAFGLYLGRLHQNRAELANPDTLLPSSPGLMPTAPDAMPGSGFDGSALPPVEAPAAMPESGGQTAPASSNEGVPEDSTPAPATTP